MFVELKFYGLFFLLSKVSFWLNESQKCDRTGNTGSAALKLQESGRHMLVLVGAHTRLIVWPLPTSATSNTHDSRCWWALCRDELWAAEPPERQLKTGNTYFFLKKKKEKKWPNDASPANFYDHFNTPRCALFVHRLIQIWYRAHGRTHIFIVVFVWMCRLPSDVPRRWKSSTGMLTGHTSFDFHRIEL